MIQAVFNRFQCKVIDGRDGTQIVSLRLYQNIDRIRSITGLDYSQEPVAEQAFDAAAEPSIASTASATIDDTPLYGSYLVETQLEEKMKDVSRIHQEIVQFYLAPLQRKTKSIIPDVIFALICLLYDYAGDDPNFLKEESRGVCYNDNMSYGIPYIESGLGGEAYFSIPIRINPIHTWIIGVRSIEEGKLALGLKSARIYYSYPSDAKPIEMISGEAKFTLIVCYDIRTQILRICAFDEDRNGFVKIVNGINYDNYRLVFNIMGHMKLSFDRYFNAEPKIIQTAVNCYDMFEAKAAQYISKLSAKRCVERRQLPQNLDANTVSMEKISSGMKNFTSLWGCLEKDNSTESFLGYLSHIKKASLFLAYIQILIYLQYVTDRKKAVSDDMNEPEIALFQKSDAVFLPGTKMSLNDVRELKNNDQIDYRTGSNCFVKATVLDNFYLKGNLLGQSKILLQIHNEEAFSTGNTSSDAQLWIIVDENLDRFAWNGSISQRAAHRLENLSKGDSVFINPVKVHPGWKWGIIERIDEKSGQVKVSYDFDVAKFSYWTHLDNKYEIAIFESKPNCKLVCDIIMEWKPLKFYRNTIGSLMYGNADNIFQDIKSKSDVLFQYLRIDDSLKTEHKDALQSDDLEAIISSWKAMRNNLFINVMNIFNEYLDCID